MSSLARQHMLITGNTGWSLTTYRLRLGFGDCTRRVFMPCWQHGVIPQPASQCASPWREALSRPGSLPSQAPVVQIWSYLLWPKQVLRWLLSAFKPRSIWLYLWSFSFKARQTSVGICTSWWYFNALVIAVSIDACHCSLHICFPVGSSFRSEFTCKMLQVGTKKSAKSHPSPFFLPKVSISHCQTDARCLLCTAPPHFLSMQGCEGEKKASLRGSN